MSVVTFNLNAPKPRLVRPRKRPTDPRRGARAAQQLALAYRIEAAIESGELRDPTHAAEVFGVTTARIAQVNALLVLAPDIQTRLLEGDTTIHERTVRLATRSADWEQQRRVIQDKR